MGIIKTVVKKCFGKYLLVTNTVSSGILMAVGDSMQQQIETYRGFHENESHDAVRSMNMAMVGIILGPIQHVFYMYLDRFIPGRDLFSVSKKLLLDQLIASPVYIVTFFYGSAYIENHTLAQANDELRHKFLQVYLVDWIVWPPTQFINFFFLPSKYRVIYLNGLTTLYNVYLSYIKHKDKVEKLDLPRKY
ncbi:unnamed protein product [Bemisia tabaci]|uniref:Mpv17-like protein 2 n=2 Tax=Bemisia tabaci TaxID=7038 RepID=A0A9P0F4M2_BEMTA|nr:PREDICTED: mpv17-like protein 2 [Bemisia tabaci]XP_018914939.1 PREDICTED: mpv17-like protein 2 [Bemisia tabaci]XP_018914940.1 PREDICTED: mpv17-like protein 2 [Bemisia tabaci]CAH0389485.1 unnamed protein product [Bemisia tabaci]